MASGVRPADLWAMIQKLYHTHTWPLTLGVGKFIDFPTGQIDRELGVEIRWGKIINRPNYYLSVTVSLWRWIAGVFWRVPL